MAGILGRSCYCVFRPLQLTKHCSLRSTKTAGTAVHICLCKCALSAICAFSVVTRLCIVLQSVHQSVAVLGIGLIAMGEDIGRDMAHRALEHLLQYGEPAVRWVVHLVSMFLPFFRVTVTLCVICSCLL